ncbi:MAG: hypothetical protein RLY35_1206 [Bacteroidota bacterium]
MKRMIIKFFRNKFVLAFLFNLIYIAFIHNINLVFIIKSKMACERLQVEIDEMKEKNLLVDQDLKDLTTNHRTLERYARETFYMKRDNEDVFVIKTNY